MKRILLAILAISVALTVAVFAGLSPSLAGFASGSGDDSGSGGGGGGGGGCSPPAPYLSVPDRLYSVAGTSPHDIWAAGLMPTDSLIMHWNGCRWAVSTSRPNGNFDGVSAVSPRDAWAVGATGWWDPAQTFAEHWNGRSWTRIATPTPGGSAVLNAVAAADAGNVWAVGYIGPGHGIATPDITPLIEHWDGSSWAVQSFSGPSGHGQFAAVAAESPSDAWAVGFAGDSPHQTTLTEHWNGSTWTRVSSPNAPGTNNILQGVTIIAPDDAWAVGFTTASDGTWRALTEHWNGSTWTVVSNPDPTGDTDLTSVSGVAYDDVWAVGYDNATRCGHGPECQTVAMHWNGSTWTVYPTPNPPSSYLNAFLGVLTLSGHIAWAVGTTDYAATLISRWNGSAWH